MGFAKQKPDEAKTVDSILCSAPLTPNSFLAPSGRELSAVLTEGESIFNSASLYVQTDTKNDLCTFVDTKASKSLTGQEGMAQLQRDVAFNSENGE